MTQEQHDLREDVDALVRWREQVESRLYFLEERLPDPADKREVRRLRSFMQIEAYRGR